MQLANQIHHQKEINYLLQYYHKNQSLLQRQDIMENLRPLNVI